MSQIVGCYRLYVQSEGKQINFIHSYIVKHPNGQVSVQYASGVLTSSDMKVDIQKVKCGFGGYYLVPNIRLGDISKLTNVYDVVMDVDVSDPESLHKASIEKPNNVDVVATLEYLTQFSKYLIFNYNDTLSIEGESIKVSKVLNPDDLQYINVTFSTYESYLTEKGKKKQEQQAQQAQPQPKSQPQVQEQALSSKAPRAAETTNSNNNNKSHLVDTDTKSTVDYKENSFPKTAMFGKDMDNKGTADQTGANMSNKEGFPVLPMEKLTPSSIAKREFKARKVVFPDIALKEVL